MLYKHQVKKFIIEEDSLKDKHKLLLGTINFDTPVLEDIKSTRLISVIGKSNSGKTTALIQYVVGLNLLREQHFLNADIVTLDVTQDLYFKGLKQVNHLNSRTNMLGNLKELSEYKGDAHKIFILDSYSDFIDMYSESEEQLAEVKSILTSIFKNEKITSVVSSSHLIDDSSFSILKEHTDAFILKKGYVNEEAQYINLGVTQENVKHLNHDTPDHFNKAIYLTKDQQEHLQLPTTTEEYIRENIVLPQN